MSSTDRTPPTPGVFVTGYAPRTPKADIEEIFSKFGSPRIRFGYRGMHCWVYFDDEAATQNSLGANGTAIGERTLIVEPETRSQSLKRNPNRIYAGNLPEATEEGVRSLFSKCGSIEKVQLFPARKYAFITFDSEEATEKAKAMAEDDGLKVAKDGEESEARKQRKLARKQQKKQKSPTKANGKTGSRRVIERVPLKDQLFVGSFETKVNEEDVRQALSEKGAENIASADVRETRGGKWYAIVKFSDTESAKNAVDSIESLEPHNVAVRFAVERVEIKRPNPNPKPKTVRSRKPALPKSEKNVFIRGLNNAVENDLIEGEMSVHGKVDSVHRITREGAFVCFADEESASKAITAGNATIGSAEVEIAEQRRDVMSLKRRMLNPRMVFVKGFNPSADELFVREAFQHVGEIAKISMRGEDDRKFAYITYTEPEAAAEAIKLDLRHLGNVDEEKKQVTIDYVTPRRRNGPVRQRRAAGGVGAKRSE